MTSFRWQAQAECGGTHELLVNAEGHEAGARPLREQVVQLALAQRRKEEAPREQLHCPPQRRLLLPRARTAAASAIAAAGAARAAHEPRALFRDPAQRRGRGHGPGSDGSGYLPGD